MTPRPLSLVLFTLLAFVVAGYGLFEARRIIEGPVISINLPVNGSATSTTGVVISGNAQNISFLTINDKASYTDQKGNFNEKLSLAPGLAVLTVAASDRFGRRTSKSVSINILSYCPLS
jgi:integral membrane sensor domain MASE1